MRVAVVSDIHGNRVALDAVREDCDADRIVCAGDVVGYNPWPRACLEWVRECEVPTVRGNHDRVAATGNTAGFNSMAAAGIRYTREHLSDEELEWLGDLPTSLTLFDGRMTVVHGHPMDPDHYTRPEEFSSRLLAQAGNPDVLVMGHTHVQSHRAFAAGVVMNPGSVGQPRDGDPRAAYAVVDLETLTVEERRVEYDVDRVLDAVREAGLPERIGTRLKEGR